MVDLKRKPWAFFQNISDFSQYNVVELNLFQISIDTVCFINLATD